MIHKASHVLYRKLLVYSDVVVDHNGPGYQLQSMSSLYCSIIAQCGISSYKSDIF